jgi:hypothetical protein
MIKDYLCSQQSIILSVGIVAEMDANIVPMFPNTNQAM